MVQREPLILDPECPSVANASCKELKSRIWRRQHQKACDRCHAAQVDENTKSNK